MSTELVFILDKSGSMDHLRDSTISDFNETLSRYQKDSPESYISLVQFDHRYHPNYIHKPVAQATPLSQETYVPSGNTSLYDTICKTIDDTGRKLAELPDWARNDLRVVVVIFTDGEENSSKEFTAADVASRISHQESKYNWQFVFMGANQDAVLTARQIGINPARALKMSNTSGGRSASNRAFYSNLAAYANSGQADALSFDAKDRQEAIQ